MTTRMEGSAPRHAAAFTLIELLIVVAIIAVLAAIAVPNFLEAQTRSKVSRAKTDMRSLATALEAYRIGNATYPVAQRHNGAYFRPLSARLIPLTTPVAFITSIPPDPFPEDISFDPDGDHDAFDYWDLDSWRLLNVSTPQPPLFRGRLWKLSSTGPDLIHTFGASPDGVMVSGLYDPTNGTKSFGDIVLLQGGGNAPDYVHHY